MSIYKEITGVISPLRLEILRLLRKELHPEELAKKFNVTRQAIDKHLSVLYRYGLVNKRIKEGTRPMVFYRITSEGEEFLENLEDAIENYIISLKKRYKEELLNLDNMLVNGKINEGEYWRHRKSLEKRLEWINKKEQ